MTTHFRQILSDIDVYPLLQQLADHNELWDLPEQWSSHKPPGQTAVEHVDTIVLRYNKSSLPGKNDWDRPAFHILNTAQQIIFDLMRAIPGEHLGKVLITRLRPGQNINWHIDQLPPNVSLYWQRFQIPLDVDPDCYFQVEDDIRVMSPGTAWWFDNQRMHQVVNDTKRYRVSMLTDIRPFNSRL